MNRLNRFVVLAIILVACVDRCHASIITLRALLDGASASPPNASPATGSAIVVYNSTYHTLHVHVDFSGLLGNTTASHIHSATAIPLSGTAGVATTTPTSAGFPNGVTNGTYDNTLDLTMSSSYNSSFISANGGTPSSAEQALVLGMMQNRAYLDIHTTLFGGGEIRGFLIAQSVEPLRVKANATGAGNGSSWHDAFTSLAAALADPYVAQVWVAAGTYKPAAPGGSRAATFSVKPGVAIYGGFAGNETALSQRNPAANLTILSGDLNGNDVLNDYPNGPTYLDNSHHVVTTTGLVVLDGFSISGGNSAGAPARNGAGLSVNTGSLTVANCKFTLNSAIGTGAAGGAVAAVSSHSAFSKCDFINNRSLGAGSMGGAAYCSSAPTDFRSCTFTQNQTGDSGGAIYSTAGAPKLVFCRFERNVAVQGGALVATGADAPYIANCDFVGNLAPLQGGAFSNTATGLTSIVNCAFVGNVSRGQPTSRGGAIFNSGAPSITNCTFAWNDSKLGGGLLNSSGNPTISGSIFWHNSDDNGTASPSEIRVVAGAPVVNHSLVEGGWAGAGGTGNLSTDPQFIRSPSSGPDSNTNGLDDDWDGVNDDYGDLRLRSVSPAIDAGDNTALPADIDDLDCDAIRAEPISQDVTGSPRLRDEATVPNTGAGTPPIVDIGAYEFGSLLGSRIFVNAAAIGSTDGANWSSAYRDLQSALALTAASPCGAFEIWVAAGTYMPDGGRTLPSGSHVNGSGNRDATFQLAEGVVLYGGFVGNETNAAQRDPGLHPTVLSGDLNGNDGSNQFGDNAYHVVTGTGTDATGTLDGFTITGGRADAPRAGGGFVTLAGGPTLRNCTLTGSAGSCAGDLHSSGGVLSVDGLTLGTSTTGADLNQTVIDLQGPLTTTSGVLSIFGSTMTGPGALLIGPGAILKAHAAPPCGEEFASHASGALPATGIFAPAIGGPSPVSERWEVIVPIHDLTVFGAVRRWVIAPSALAANATLTWTGSLPEQDLSAGGRAEAVFHEGGVLTITGALYDGPNAGAALLYNGVLLTARVGSFHVFESTTTSNVLSFVEAPVLQPTGGFLVANSQGFVIAGNQVLSATFAIAQQNGGALSSFAPTASISLSAATSLSIDPVNLPQSDTIIRSRIEGTGQIQVDLGAKLILEASASLNLSGLPDDVCATNNTPGAPQGGSVAVSGTLIAREHASVYNTHIQVNGLTLNGDNSIIHNNIALVESSVGFGGQFFTSDHALIACNMITSEGDRYLDLDPDPTDGQNPTLQDNEITVLIRQGVTGNQGELLELRSVDWDYAAEGGGQSGAWPLASSAGDAAAGGGGFTDTWVLEKLEVFANAKVNLTNRQGFVFQNPAIPIPEALYVKTIKLHPGAVLNTGLQRMYYQTLVDENDVPLTVNPNDPHALLANGSRMVDVPLLGFSLKVIAMEDDTEFGVRLRTRLRDVNDVQPPAAPFKEGEVVRVAAPIPTDPTNHAMAMRTSKTNCSPGNPPCPSASSIAAHGAFARSGEAQIEVKFNFKFCGQPGDELIVYLSDAPDVLSGNGPSPNLVEVARLYPPASGPGSIASSDFAAFSGRFARGSLNFTRGTYVELELRGQDACVLIDDFDPVVCLWCACGDFSGEGACGVEPIDYLYLLSEYGNGVNDTNLCADQMGQDHYVDLSDLMNWSSAFHDPAVLNLCDGTAGTSTGSANLAALPGGLTVAGKPIGDGQNDSLYLVNPQTFVAGAAIPAPGQHNGTRSGNGPLVKNGAGVLHQLHGVMGLIRLSDGQVTLVPKTFNNVSLPGVTAGSTVRVGLTTGGGYALLDTAFDPTDSTGNTLFILPVQVDPPALTGSGCPYRAAAKVQLTGNGNCNLLALYGANPAIGSTVVSTSLDCAEIVFAPDASRMRELDVDAFGNLFVISAQGVNDNNYILIHPIGGSEIRVSLAGQVQAPTALHVSGDFLYVSTSLDGPNTADTVIHRYLITRSANAATGLNTTPAGHAVINIPGIRFLTAITTNTTDGRLYAAGFGSLSCSREACNANPDCPLGCHFDPGDPIFTTPMIAVVTNPTAAIPLVTTTTITGSNLSLPISLTFSSVICGTGDLDSNGATNPADIAPFVNALLNPTPATLCPADINGDNSLNGKDVQPFVRHLIGG